MQSASGVRAVGGSNPLAPILSVGNQRSYGENHLSPMHKYDASGS